MKAGLTFNLDTFLLRPVQQSMRYSMLVEVCVAVSVVGDLRCVFTAFRLWVF